MIHSTQSQRLLPGQHVATSALIVAGLALGSVSAPVAHAASITVTTTADELNADGDCSLREAVRAANLDARVDACLAGNGADTITLPAGTYLLTQAGSAEDGALTGDLDIIGQLAISGAGAARTRIDGNQHDRVFDIQAGANVTIAGVTVTGGRVLAGVNMWSRDAGGGISNRGTLTLINSMISHNSTTFEGGGSGFGGGGIWNVGDGVLSVINSTVSNNAVVNGAGGGIVNHATLVLENSTISNNTADRVFNGDGGGIYNGGTITINNSTIQQQYSNGHWWYL